MATIHDVAKLAGVSVATVSRVLNGNYPVSEKRIKIVMDAVQALDFQPNILGRNLGRTSNKTILIESPVFSTSISYNMLAGVKEVVQEEKYDLLLSFVESQERIKDVDNEAAHDRLINDYFKNLKNGLAGGVLIFPNFPDHLPVPAEVEKYPVVLCSESINYKFPFCVSVNNEQAAYDLTTLLIKQGRKRIAYLAYANKEKKMGPAFFSVERENGIRNALAAHGLPFYPELRQCVVSDSSSYGEERYVNATLVTQNYIDMPAPLRPDAIICSFDILALACINTLQRAKISIPSEIAVAGFDDDVVTSFSLPQITSVRQPFYEMGRTATRMLIALMRGETVTEKLVKLSHQVIERGSTNPMLL